MNRSRSPFEQRVLVLLTPRQQLLEPADVQVEGRSLQTHGKAIRLDQILTLRTQHLLQLAQGLAQAGPRQRLGRGVPEERCQLLAVHPAAGAQQQQTQQKPRLAGPERHLFPGRHTGNPAGPEEIDLEPEHAVQPQSNLR